jgi:competence protein ComEA
MPPAERRALLLLLSLAVAGQGVRHVLTRPGEPPGQVQLLASLSPGSPLAQRDSAMRLARPLGPGERVDVDRAPAQELTRLPKVGPRLAKVIQADREEHGIFGSLENLDRVPGVGPGLLKIIAPHVAFSGAGALRGDESASGGAGGPSLKLNTATLAELDALPGIGPAKAAAVLQYREQHGPFASVDDLSRVPGFGPGAVARLKGQLVAP